MKRLAAALMILVILVSSAALYLRLAAQLSIISASVEARPAVDAGLAFDELTASITDGSFTGTILSDADLTLPDGYDFLIVTVRLRNYGMLPAEWVRIEIAPDPTHDVIMMGEPRGFSLAAFSTGAISGTMLSRTGGGLSRAVTVRYYVFGRMLTVSTVIE